MKPPQAFLYEKIASELSQAIRNGVYAVNERLPSLRQIRTDYGVSLATAVQAYQRLESEGLIQPRPKSGYVVRPWLDEHSQSPAVKATPEKPTTVNMARLAMSLVTESRSPRLIRLGAAVPAAELMPLAALSRIAAGVARRYWQDGGRYPESNGAEALRRQIARLMGDAGVRCTANDIIITNGCLEALHLSLRVVTKPGDIVLIESPTYFGILQVIESLGLKALEVETNSTTGVDVPAVERALTKHDVRACVLMPTYSNPLGSTMTATAKRELVTLLARHNIPLIEDDLYGVLAHERPRPPAAKSFDKSGDVIYCSSFSKTVAPGLRLGWIVAGNHYETIHYQKFLENISSAIHPQLLMAEFLAGGGYQRHMRRAANVYRRRMDQMRHWIRSEFPPQTRMTQPSGGLLLWVELPRRVNTLMLYEQAMKKHISISPGVLFSPKGQYSHHLRLSCGAVDGDKMQASIRTLGALIASLL